MGDPETFSDCLNWLDHFGWHYFWLCTDKISTWEIVWGVALMALFWTFMLAMAVVGFAMLWGLGDMAGDAKAASDIRRYERARGIDKRI